MSQEILPRTMVLDEFLPHLDTVFTLHCEPKDAQIRLVEAYPMKDHARLERPPFILIFHSDPMTLLLEGLYVLRAPGFDPAAVHIMSVGAPPGSAPGHYYQAVFN